MSSTDANQASEDELQPFTSLFQNAAVARDCVTGCVSEEDINELAAHIFFIEPTYKYDISKAPIDNVFSAYRIAAEKLIRTEKLKLLAEVRERVVQGLPDTTFLGTSIRVKDNIRDDGYHDGVLDSRLATGETLSKLEAEL